jgi:hypothetical protein
MGGRLDVKTLHFTCYVHYHFYVPFQLYSVKFPHLLNIQHLVYQLADNSLCTVQE